MAKKVDKPLGQEYYEKHLNGKLHVYPRFRMATEAVLAPLVQIKYGDLKILKAGNEAVEKKKSYIVASNHRTWLDIFIQILLHLS
jgi:1-acyl-sn-glycerol-3-phosphate acyltransferase